MRDRIILHSDINCCYANIEHLYHPEYTNKPLAVGGNEELRHGIILTADYMCKKRGVKTGMTIWEAKKLCQDIVIIPPHMDLYLRFSKLANDIYRDYTDRIEPYGIDESWLDVTESSIYGSGEEIAERIRKRMKEELGITVSIGVSFNKIFAKLGSDMKKPDAITVIQKEEYKKKAWPLPVEDLLYVGKSTKKKLNNLGIYTIGQLAQTDESIIRPHLGKIGCIIQSFANGQDDSPVCMDGTISPAKSIGNSITAAHDLTCDDDVRLLLLVLSESVASRLRENHMKCNTIELSIRDSNLYSFTRQKKIQNQTNISSEIAAETFILFKRNWSWEYNKAIRSIGIKGMDLIPEFSCEQLDLYTDPKYRQKMLILDKTVDHIRSRFGYQSIQRGVMYTDRGLSSTDVKEEHTVHPHSYFK